MEEGIENNLITYNLMTSELTAVGAAHCGAPVKFCNGLVYLAQWRCPVQIHGLLHNALPEGETFCFRKASKVLKKKTTTKNKPVSTREGH